MPALLRLWADSVGAFPLSETVLADRLRLGRLDRSAIFAAGARLGGELVGFAYLTAQDRGAVQLSPMRLQAVIVDARHRRGGIGTALSRSLLARGAEAGAQAAAAGGGVDYVWPGIPVELDGAIEFMTAIGFRLVGTSYDLRSTNASVELARQASAPLDRLGVLVRTATRDELPAVVAFVAREFDADWVVDLRDDIDDGLDPRDVLVALDRSDALVAFARLHTPGSRPVAPPLFWAGRRGPDAGGLGPIGVARSQRGLGLGTAFLGRAITELADRGATDVVIDFTDRLAFYGRLGFVPWMTFRHATAEPPRTGWMPQR